MSMADRLTAPGEGHIKSLAFFPVLRLQFLKSLILPVEFGLHITTKHISYAPDLGAILGRNIRKMLEDLGNMPLPTQKGKAHVLDFRQALAFVQGLERFPYKVSQFRSTCLLYTSDAADDLLC